MKLIKPKYEILEQKSGIDGIYEQIELAGRTCYKSERPEGKTAMDFVNKLIKSKHYAMLEHGTVYLKIPCTIVSGSGKDPKWEESKYKHNPYSKVEREYIDNEGNYFDFITTNYRVLVENEWLDDLQYLCEPTEFHEKRVTVKFITSIGIVRELLRHRKFSFANESTRYCNYSKDKFNHEITFIIPNWCRTKVAVEITGPRVGFAMSIEKTPLKDEEKTFYAQLKNSEDSYMFLLKYGLTPQQAREVLPLATKSELVMTGFVSDWKYLFDLRVKGTTGIPHPDIKALCEPLMNEFIKNKLING